MTDTLIPSERIERAILLIRGQKVMLDRDLAALYGVPVKVLNQAVARNRERFPQDFMFQLSIEEFRDLRRQFGASSQWRSPSVTTESIDYKHVVNLRSQFVTSSSAWGGRRYRPHAFTEQGVAMLSSVLRSTQAIQVNIAIMRAFVKLRELLATHADLARKLSELEAKYDSQFAAVFDAIRQLMTPPPEPPRQKIGFEVHEGSGLYEPLDPIADSARHTSR